MSGDTSNDWGEAYALFPGDVAYIWHASWFIDKVAQNIRDCDFEIRYLIIWKKNNFAIGRGHYHWQHEPCFYAVRKGGSAEWIGDRKQSTVWEVDMLNNTSHGGDDMYTNHGTQKPLELMARPIRNHAGAVYDPFLGSGTTLIAAEQFNRACYGMEIDPEYCDIIVNRWERFTGKQAEKI